MRKSLYLLGVFLLALTSCGREHSSRAEPVPAKTAATTSVPVAADMCAEHGVLEALCTKCHPKLIPIFQSKGDWCPEHGFPESICPICHPERGGRPATEVAIDEAPAEGTLVRFKTVQTAREAGLEVEIAVQGQNSGGVEATATIVADASSMAVVNARAAGVVRAIQADLGSRVKCGSPLAIIESASVGESRSRLIAARVRVEAAEANYRREKELHAQGMSPAKTMQAAQQEWESARAEAATASSALEMVGADSGASGTYTLQAPIAGVVTKRIATIGTMVDLEDPLFEVINTASLWADIDVPEREVQRVRVGQRVVLQLDGLGAREFSGTISYVAPVVDPQTRTAKARAAIPNADGALRANMYARARILTDAGRAVLVPRAAVQEAKGTNLVFVRLAEDRYEARRVKVAQSSGNLVAVNGGVKAGDAVVTVGSFLLKTETMKEGIGAGCCDVEAPKK